MVGPPNRKKLFLLAQQPEKRGQPSFYGRVRIYGKMLVGWAHPASVTFLPPPKKRNRQLSLSTKLMPLVVSGE